MPLERVDVSRLQALIESKGARWRAAVTSVSELSEERKKLLCGALRPKPPGQAISGASQTAAKSVGGAPPSFDWRNVDGANYITPIKDQGGCGSCVAFGTVATLEGTYQAGRGDASTGIDLSEGQLFYCGAAGEGYNCETGWYADHALNYAANPGIADESCFPYSAGDQGCSLCSDWQNRVVRAAAWHSIPSVDDMKSWISSIGPLSACFCVYNDFFSYVDGVYTHVTGDVAGGHCISVIGYDDSAGCWMAKNSWGTGWGESGFFQIAYGQGAYPDGTGAIDSQMWAIDGIVATGWENNRQVEGLWSIDQDRNAWAYFDGGVGWRKISPDDDNIFLDALVQLTSAKEGGRPVSFYEDQGVIKQLYVV